MTEAATPVTDKNVIDGVKVVHREMARIFTPLSKYEDGLSPTYGVDKCVLEDSRVVFQCVCPDPPECNYWHLEGISVRSHLRVHKLAKERAKAADIKKERDALKMKEAMRTENFRRGALKGAAKRRANAAATHQHGTDNGNGATAMAEKDRQKLVDGVQTSLEGAAEGLERIGTVILNIRKTVENAVQTMEDLSSTAPAVDPVLAQKAASWDAMQALLNPGNKR